MKQWLVPASLLTPVFLSAQCIYVTDTTYVRFFSEEIVQDIDAHSTQLVGAWNHCTDSVFFKVPSASFTFTNALMEEHYEEQYMEVHLYPFITFRGALRMEGEITRPGTYPATASGTFTIHGVSRQETISGTITVLPSGKIQGEARFWIVPTDYGIRQPSMLGITAADSVEITIWFRMVPYQKRPRKAR